MLNKIVKNITTYILLSSKLGLIAFGSTGGAVGGRPKEEEDGAGVVKVVVGQRRRRGYERVEERKGLRRMVVLVV